MHVLHDFPDKHLIILDDGQTTLGMESTLIKIEECRIIVYRLGSLSVHLI